jgi:hypothetical protein
MFILGGWPSFILTSSIWLWQTIEQTIAKAEAAVKWIEVVNPIPDERGIILHPCLRPCAAESKLEPIFEDARNSQTHS